MGSSAVRPFALALILGVAALAPARVSAGAWVLPAKRAWGHGVKDADGVLLPLRLSQQDLANLIGVTRESVNLVLADFREPGWRAGPCACGVRRRCASSREAQRVWRPVAREDDDPE